MSFDGLQLHFSILLILGCLLFLTGLVVLIIFAVKGRKILGAAVIIVISVVMVAFPAIESVEITKDGVKLKNLVDKSRAGELDAAGREELTELAMEMESRPYAGTGTLLDLAEAKLVLGDRPAALELVDQVLEAEADNPRAHELKVQLRGDIRPPIRVLGIEPHVFDERLARFRENRRDPKAREGLIDGLEKMGRDADFDPGILPQIVEGWAELKEMDQAQAALNGLFEFDPNHSAIKPLAEKYDLTIPR